MHENLKFNVTLDENIQDFESLDSITNQFDNVIEKAKISDWQSIYSENDYGTQYLIYAKFLGKKINNTSFKINKIQLFIQNYDGSITLGFNKNFNFFFKPIELDHIDNDPREKYKNRKKYLLGVALEAFKMEDHNTNLDVDVIINEGDLLVTESFFTPAITNLSRIFEKDHIKKSNFVDPKFMKRIGDDIFITDEGYKKLHDLHGIGLITEKQFLGTGFHLMDNESIEKVKNLPNKLLITGRKYPCIPRNSIFSIK